MARGYKVEEKSEYKTLLGPTKYAIPMFGYRSALFIGFAILVAMIASILISDALSIDFRWIFTVLESLAFGLSIGLSQYFIERKKGFTKGFFLTTGLFSLISFIVFYLCLFKGIVVL